jgi:hypothetical protein
MRPAKHRSVFRSVSRRRYGARRINDSEAEIVRRIFRLFAGGMSPRAVAKKLNAEGIKGLHRNTLSLQATN